MDIIKELERLIDEKEKEIEETTDTYNLQALTGYIDGLKKAIEVIKTV